MTVPKGYRIDQLNWPRTLSSQVSTYNIYFGNEIKNSHIQKQVSIYWNKINTKNEHNDKIIKIHPSNTI